MPSQQPQSLGTCPDCTTEITTVDVLIKYESGDGRQAVWAECPGCREVVDPV